MTGSMTGRTLYWLLDGRQPIPCPSVTVWGEAWGKIPPLAHTDIGRMRVSTIFLGIDHNFGEVGPPILFESMIFGGPLDGQQRRYVTWEEARQGHIELVTECMAIAPWRSLAHRVLKWLVSLLPEPKA